MLQIPPNLVVSREYVVAAIGNGARDLGGLGPIDEVNPDYAHPTPAILSRILRTAGWHLRPRLPVYPQYDDWLPTQLQEAVARWRGRELSLR